jgi:hypothetical protein
VLAADFAVELADAELLVQLDNDGLFVVAEEAGKGRGEGLTLRKQTGQRERKVVGSYSNLSVDVPSLGLAACAMTSCVFPGGGSGGNVSFSS